MPERLQVCSSVTGYAPPLALPLSNPENNNVHNRFTTNKLTFLRNRTVIATVHSRNPIVGTITKTGGIFAAIATPAAAAAMRCSAPLKLPYSARV